MISAMNFVRAAKFAAMILAGLSLAACANNPNQLNGANAGLAGSAAPGSAQDFVVVKLAFGKSVGQPGYDGRADFTGDSTVSAQDFNLLSGNFGQGGAPPIGPAKP